MVDLRHFGIFSSAYWHTEFNVLCAEISWETTHCIDVSSVAAFQITDKGKKFTVMAALRRSRNKRASMSAVVPIGVPPSTDGVIDITRVEASAMYVPLQCSCCVS